MAESIAAWQPPDEVLGLAVALAIGLLIGLEREHDADSRDGAVTAGVRTFTLIALAGGTAALLGPVALAIGGAFVVAAAIASYWSAAGRDRGLTTEVAMLVVFLLGALAHAAPALAAGTAVVVAAALAGKATLHRFARESLSRQDLHDLLLLAAAALVVLPLLPEAPLDPWQALNPRRLWLLVVLVMAINAAGYVALRLFGPRWGPALAGFAGGFVSSTATIASFGSRARERPKLLRACVCAALMSSVATVIQLALILAATSPAVLRALALPLAAAGAAALGAALLAGWGAFRAGPHDATVEAGRAFKLGHAFAFAALVGAALLLAAFLHARYGESGSIAAAAAAGFADAHAAALSAAQLAAAGTIEPVQALWPVVAAVLTNSVSKLVVAGAQGGRAYFLRVLPGLLAIDAALLLGAWGLAGR